MIRVINPKDTAIAQDILRIQQAAYLQESLLIDYPNLPPLKETLSDIQGSSETFLAYEVNKKIVGVLSYSVKDKTLTIARLVVHPDFARQGIGQTLLEYVSQHSTMKHFVVSTAAKNIPAIRLYEKHGFVLVSKQTLPDGLALVRLEIQN